MAISFESYDRREKQILAKLAEYGISSIEDAEEFLRLGAERLGTSRIVKIVKQQESKG